MNRLSLRCSGPTALVIFAALSLGAAACTTEVAIDGGGGGGTSPTTTVTSATTGMEDTTTGSLTTGSATTGGGGGGLPQTSIAVFDMTIPQVPAATKQSWLTAGEALDPQTLLVIVSTRPQACNDPDFDLSATNYRQIMIGLPPALQAVGKYDIASTDVIGFGSSWLSDGMGNGGGGGGPLLQGTVEVLSIDAGSIKVRFEGVPQDFVDSGVDHVVSICPSGV
ncbi:MAG: hypothetical protein ABJE95_19870 [Byssovorax sp.]